MRNKHTLSSLSRDHIESVKNSDQVSAYKLNKKQAVDVITIDKLINQHSILSFIKINVEDCEHKVLEELTRSLYTISLYTVSTIGDVQLSYSRGEFML